MSMHLAISVNYIVFGPLIYNGEGEKKINIPKGGTFCRVYEHKRWSSYYFTISPQLLIVKPIRHKVSLYANSNNFIPRLKDFMYACK